MSDRTVHTALRSDAQLVLIEAPAGCGKTHQGADYVREIAGRRDSGRPLVLTHTHAACSVFADRTHGTKAGVDIRTIDSLIGQVASVYHAGLGLPADIAAWVRQHNDGYNELAVKVAGLLKRKPMIAASLSQRHPVVICDEHQDSTTDQHAIIMALLREGARLRVFADPMQSIFKDSGVTWEQLASQAQAHEFLDTPHRWSAGSTELGQWTLNARDALKSGGKVDLRSHLPDSVSLVFAENQARKYGEYQLLPRDRQQIDHFERGQSSLLILTSHNKTAQSFRSFFNRRLPLWEGHTRPALERLVNKITAGAGEAAPLADAIVDFIAETERASVGQPSATGSSRKHARAAPNNVGANQP